MTFLIISESETTLLVLENGKNKQLSKDLYNLIRVKRFNNERIIQTFNDINSDDEIEVQETFNKGIFNVKYKDVVIQLRNRMKFVVVLRIGIILMKLNRWLNNSQNNIKYKREPRLQELLLECSLMIG